MKVDGIDYVAQATLFLNESKLEGVQGLCSVVVHHEALSRLRPGFKSRCEHLHSDVAQYCVYYTHNTRHIWGTPLIGAFGIIAATKLLRAYS